MSVKDVLKNPLKIFFSLGHRGLLNWMSDETYLKIGYRIRMGKRLNLDNPQTFNEKLQWLKIHDRKPEYTTMVDKYEAKKYVAERIGEEYVIPTLGVWDKFDDIDFDSLPDQFVLKCTHDSGGLVICRDKSTLDIKKARRKIENCLKHNFYYSNREWPYKDVKPRIIAEKFMVDESGYELKDYKIFCFDGAAKAMFIASDRSIPGEETKFDFYDMNFKHLPFTNGHPNSTKEIKRPESFEEMKSLAEKLSKDIPQARIDFYDINGKVYFGEVTFSHWSGMMPFVPEKWDYTFGEFVKIPEKFGGGVLIFKAGYMIWIHKQKEKSLDVYKFFCFDGHPYILQMIQNDKQENETIDYYDMKWNRLNLKQNYPNSKIQASTPAKLSEMVDIAKKLSQNKKGFIRVDLYFINDKIFFSEYTFFSDAGFAAFYPPEWDKTLGNKLNI